MGPSQFLAHLLDSSDDEDQAARTASFIGIVVAISGNILISLALNCQKLAHRRLNLESNPATPSKSAVPSPRRSPLNVPDELPLQRYSSPLGRATTVDPTTPLRPKGSFPRYNSSPIPSRLALSSQAGGTIPVAIPEDTEVAGIQDPIVGVLTVTSPTEVDDESTISTGHGADPYTDDDHTTSENGDAVFEDTPTQKEGAYLKSKLWWFGFALMNIGEFGNFLSYAYAPASVVAPLGTFALIANCVFAPVLLKERFRMRDLLGVALCICGAVTVVFSSKSSDIRLDPDALVHALTQRTFLIYSGVTVLGIFVLLFLSERPVGRDYIWIDLGLCALFGGYTVLSTKAVSTLISLEWIQIYKHWITYPTIIVLVGTGVGQVRHLNRALQKFESKVVIPTNFVLFTISAITGSAVLYGDFDTMSLERMIIFLYGCGTTFLGVFILARPQSAPALPPDEPRTDSGARPSPSHHYLSQNTMPTLTPGQYASLAHAQGYALPGSSAVSTPASVNASLERTNNNSFSPSTSPTASWRPTSTTTRPRAASTTGIGMSPGQYLLLATSTTPPNAPGPLIVTTPSRGSPRPLRTSSRSPTREGRGVRRKPSIGE